MRQGTPDAMAAGIFACGSAMSCCEKAGEWRVALQLLRQMKEPGIGTNCAVYIFICRSVSDGSTVYMQSLAICVERFVMGIDRWMDGWMNGWIDR